MKITFTLIILFYSVELMTQKAGTLDSSFGVGGITLLKSLVRTFDCMDAAQQADGKTICVGSLFSAIRLDNSGRLDSGFGNHGEFFLSPDLYFALTGNAVAIQPDNKIIITGTGIKNFSNPDYDIVTIRLTANGMLDSSFGINGIAIFNYGTGDVAYDLVLQPDGKILIQGSSSGNFNTLRYLNNGILDESFGNNGSVIAQFGAPATGFGIALQSDGKIVAVGATDEKAIMARYLSDGSIDASFGVNGKITYKFDNQTTLARDVVIQADGKIVVTGNISRIFSDSLFVARYNEDGSLDESFGNNGSMIPAFKVGAVGWKLGLQNDNKIVTCGFTNDGFVRHFLLSRFQSNGTLDSSFANDGMQQTTILVNDAAYGLVLADDNKIILAGTSKDGISDYPSITEYFNDTKSKKQIIVQKIKHYIQTHNAQATTLNTVSVYPNPAQNILHVEDLSSLQKTKLAVIDFSGNVIMSLELSVLSGVYDLNVSSLHAGNYLLKIETNGEVVTKQFVKE